MLLGEGMRQRCSHLCPTLATTPADVGNRAGCGVAQCMTFKLYLDLDAGRSLVLAGIWRRGQEDLSASGSLLLTLSPHWQGMSELLLVNLTSWALFQEQQ